MVGGLAMHMNADDPELLKKWTEVFYSGDEEGWSRREGCDGPFTIWANQILPWFCLKDSKGVNALQHNPGAAVFTNEVIARTLLRQWNVYDALMKQTAIDRAAEPAPWEPKVYWVDRYR